MKKKKNYPHFASKGRANMFTMLPAFLLLTICFLIPETNLKAQCAATVPTYTVNFVGNPTQVYTSPPTSRENGGCCTSNDRCIQFVIIPDPNTAGITFQQITGPDPGSYFLVVDCGAQQDSVGKIICLDPTITHRLAFCKPGNNIYQYTVTSIPKPIPLADDTLRVGCSKTFNKIGITAASAVWNSIAPGGSGAYNSFLSCTSACLNPVFTPTSVPPGGFIDYVVSGSPTATGCGFNPTVYDTVRVYVYAALTATISPNPASFCPSSGGVTLTATPGGGLGPYGYSWSPVTNSTSTYFATSAGTYTVTISDKLSNKCGNTSASRVVTVTSISSVPTHTDVSCFGSCNGTATATVSGGTPPYTYQWTGTAQTTGTVTGLCAGTYSVLITGGCTTTNSYTITQPTALNASVTGFTNVTCNGNTNGTINTSVSGGTPGYTFLWSPSGKTTQNISGIGPGTYTLTVTDAHGCTKQVSQVITQPPALSPLPNAAVTGTDLTCHGNSSGSICINTSPAVLGGTPPYTYSWCNGQTTACIFGLPAGCFCLRIIDANTCTVDTTVCLAEPDTINTTVDGYSTYVGDFNVSCFGASNGSAHVSVTGGTAPYSYVWNTIPAQTTATATGLAAGTYSVTVNDSNNCTVVHNNVIITQPPPLVPNLTAKLYAGGYNIACKGEASGYIYNSVSGGAPSYTYLWQIPATLPFPNNPTDTNLVRVYAGFYQVKVTDANGCTAVDTITLTEPDTLVPLITKVDFNGVNVSCFGVCDGKITVVSVTGGTPAFSYLWNQDTSQTGSSISGLCVSENLLHISDDNGCVLDTLITLIGPADLGATLTPTDLTCNSNGSGIITTTGVTGGVPGYQYSWNTTPVQTTASASGLAEGNYCLRITDLNGCHKDFCADVAQPDTLDATTSSFDVLCKSVPTGSASVVVSGGTGSYTYLWSPVPATTSSISNLAAGTYCVHITDANGCAANKCFTIIEPVKSLNIDSLVPTVYPGGWNISCNGGADGNVTSYISGGTAGYTYFWNYNYTTANLTGVSFVPAPPYTLTVTDAHGCTAVDSIHLTEPAKVVSTPISVTPVFCFGDTTGVINVGTTGGTGPYKYYIGGIQHPNPITGLTLGTYTITTVDVNGCSDTSLVVAVTQPPGALRDSLIRNIPTCKGVNSGVLQVLASGGTAPYSYSWNSTPIQTTATATGLPAGTYTVTVSDSLGCKAQISGIVISLTTLSASVTGTVTSCTNANTGVATVGGLGGAAPYTYQWLCTSQTTPTATGLPVGTCKVVVIDTLGCRDTTTATIAPSTFTASITDTVSSCTNALTGVATATPGGGVTPYTYVWSCTSQTTPTVTGLNYGACNVVVTDSLGCKDTLNFNIAPSTFTASVLPTLTSCTNANTGTALATPSGGVSPYAYAWSCTSMTTASVTGLAPGTCSVIVVDSLGCRDTLSFSITPSTFTASVLPTQTSCTNVNNGTALATPNGGVSPYTYAWSCTLMTTASVTGLAPGTCSVIVVDSLGCSDTLNFNITPSTFTANVVPTQTSCTNANTGKALATPNGGVSPYTYAWSCTSMTTASVTGLAPGTCSVIVVDSLGCSDTLNFSITPSTFTASVVPTQTSCTNANTGTALATPNGGVSPYTYVWSCTGLSTPSVTGLAPGSCTVIVTDNLGCKDTLNFNITPSTFTASVAPTQTSCTNANTGTALATPNGGVSPYTYTWLCAPGQTTASVTGLAPGSCTVIVVDSLGCKDTLSFSITPSTFTASVTPTGISCKNINTGKGDAAALGGQSPYTYTWSCTSMTTASVTGLAPGTCSVIVVDALGCRDTLTTMINTNQLTATDTIADPVSCDNKNTGSATAIVITPGIPPYSYNWSNGQTTPTATALGPGTYGVIVTDSMGCTDTLSSIIIGQKFLQLTASTKLPSCKNNNTGTAEAFPTGGTQPYTYSWSDNQSTKIATGLNPGTYSVIVVDSIGCRDTVTTVIIPIDTLTATLSSVKPSCTYINNGTAKVVPTGGTVPYTYSWSTTPVQTADSAVGLPPGATYTVIVYDAIGCTDTLSTVFVDSNVVAAATARSRDTICVQDFEGRYELQATDPSPATGIWHIVHGTGTIGNPTSLNTFYQNVPKDTAYHVIQWIVTNNDCSDTAEVNLVISHVGRCLDLELPNGFSPNGDGPNDTYVMVGIERYPVNTFKVFNRWGNEVFSMDNYQNHNSARDWEGQNNNGEPLPAGTYYVILVTDNGNIQRNTYVDLRR